MQLILDFPVRSRYSFDNFVACSGNETALRFAQRLASPDAGENLLYLHGPAGSGKTHLLEACAEAIGSLGGEAKPLPVFSFKETPGIAPQAIGTLLQRRFHDSPALLIDDLHLIPADQALKVQLWQMFNDYHAGGKPVVITGIHPPKELPNLDEHLTSRLLWGLVARVDVSDDDSRRMIMRKLAADRQMILPGEVTEFLLRHLPRDIPTLISTLDRIVRHSLATGRKVSTRLATEVLTDKGDQP
jgi:chromosomal replication initiator protein